jgi:hypothetical protein
MQSIDFLRNFFTKGLEIHYSFLSYFSKKIKFFKLSNFKIKKCHLKIFNFLTFNFEKSPNFEFKKSPNFEPVPKGRSHSRQKHLPGCFHNYNIKKQLLSKLLEESNSLWFSFVFLSKSKYKKQN